MSKTIVSKVSPSSGDTITFNGGINAPSATFSDNISIGGTLTYESVADVDSAGIITARKGIDVNVNGIDAVGVITATSFSGSGSDLTGIEAGGTANFVASGNIPNGATVVINADGTVGIVTATGSATPSVGSPDTFAGTLVNYPSAVYDYTNQKVVVAYNDGSDNNYGKVVVGTFSYELGVITFGTPVTFNSANTAWIATTYDPDTDKVIICYQNSGNSAYGTAVVGTISGSTMTFGTPVVFESGDTRFTTAIYDTTNDKVVIAYRDANNSDYGTAVVGTVSGTSISFGTPVVFESLSTWYTSAAFDSNSGKVVIAYQRHTSPNMGAAIVGTVSGSSISFGSAVVFDVSDTDYEAATFDSSNNKIIIAYRDRGNSDYGTAIVATVSGSSISFGSPTVFQSSAVEYIAITYDSTNNKAVIAYRDDDDPSDAGKVVEGTVSGTSITFSSPTVFNSDQATYISPAFDSTRGKVNIAFRDFEGSAYRGIVVDYTCANLSTNLTTENYIGIAAESISNGATGKVNIIGGVNTGQTGLTTAQTYYVQSNGTLSTSADNPSVVGGVSLSTTNLLVK